eukprot:4309856-Amphidinium_carterae.1
MRATPVVTQPVAGLKELSQMGVAYPCAEEWTSKVRFGPWRSATLKQMKLESGCYSRNSFSTT